MLPEIALGLALRAVRQTIPGGKALNDRGAERLPTSIKLRMPENDAQESDSVR